MQAAAVMVFGDTSCRQQGTRTAAMLLESFDYSKQAEQDAAAENSWDAVEHAVENS
jgi:hypothetical protein